MSSDQPIISVRSLGKQYQIYARPADRLKQMVMPRLRRAIGRDGNNYYEDFWALRNVSFDVRRGETLGIIGNNGSGKSTLLQMICGTLHPSEGEVATTGRIAALLELGAGFNPDFTGEENVYLSGLLYGIPEAELRKRFDSILAFADIGKFIDQPVKTYSSGMYVRLAFAIAAHVDADTLVIDEALSVGDARFTQKCMRYLRGFQERGTLLFVSHDTGAVINLCSRAIWLDKGSMKNDGSARHVVEQYLAEQHAEDRSNFGESVSIKTQEGAFVPKSQGGGRDSYESRSSHSRRDVTNGMPTRNLVEVFEFNPDKISSEFGARGATVLDVKLVGEEGHARDVISGGEVVEVQISVKAEKPAENLIIGFHIKDRLGQFLFGDNTYLSYLDEPICAVPGNRYRARFRFRMPVLPNGDYSIDAAVATGTQEDHTQQHWIRDALIFRSSVSTLRHGLVGIPMLGIQIDAENAP